MGLEAGDNEDDPGINNTQEDDQQVNDRALFQYSPLACANIGDYRFSVKRSAEKILTTRSGQSTLCIAEGD